MAQSPLRVRPRSPVRDEAADAAPPPCAKAARRGGRRHAEMEALLAREEAERPNFGTVDKCFFGPVDLRKEREAFWTRVRGCAEHLEATAAERRAILATRDAHLAEVNAWVVGAPNARGKPITKRARVAAIARALARADADTHALLPEPMRCQNWKRLRFYPEVLRKHGDAAAFLDPDATPDECALALESGLHVLCGRHPGAAFGVPALLTALLRFYVRDQHVPHECAVDKRARLKTKSLHMEAFVQQLRAAHLVGRAGAGAGAGADAAPPPSLPEEAIGVLVEALSGDDEAAVAFAARALGALPVAALAPHAERVSEAVGAQAAPERKRSLAHVEALVRRVNAPAALDMRAELASALGQA